MSLQAMGDTAYLITLSGKMDAAMLARVRALAASLAADRIAGITEIVPAYASVGVVYEPERVRTSHGELPWHAVAEWLEKHLAGKGLATKPAAAREHVVPVCYGGEYGPDLDVVSKAAKRSADEVVKKHTGASYVVAAIGFTPGFPYLLGLPDVLATPRRATPRLRVPAGSVGIGGAQTGIYPRETPGGWQLIGRTGLELFDPTRELPASFAAGDRVKFKAVDKYTAPRITSTGTNGDRREAPAGGGLIEVIKPG
ncbi:MAG: 5-oxoprolinase subunit PxpB, partial [Burkholderiales bacterium]|nr:5-oxoprolinase subunit PxpB [Opitutaceae bacterium]